MKTRQDSLFRCQSICKGSGYYSASKEDRIIVIPDLIEYIQDNYSNYSRNTYEETELFSIEQLLSGNEDKIIKLYAVFDGHCGSFCSTYLQQMFPFELCANVAFKNSHYQLGLQETYTNLHKKLLKCKDYKPEDQTYIYCSGSTASVALVTEEETFFAFLGDSPILVWRNTDDKPKMLFQEHNIENVSLHQHLIDSNIFLVLSQPQNHKPLSKIITETEEKQKILDKFNTNSSPKKHHKNQRSNKSRKNDLKAENIRIGFSALNVWGTLGDSIYEPEIFNTFVQEMETFRNLRRERLNQLATQLKSKPKPSLSRTVSLMDVDPKEEEEDKEEEKETEEKKSKFLPSNQPTSPYQPTSPHQPTSPYQSTSPHQLSSPNQLNSTNQPNSPHQSKSPNEKVLVQSSILQFFNTSPKCNNNNNTNNKKRSSENNNNLHPSPKKDNTAPIIIDDDHEYSSKDTKDSNAISNPTEFQFEFEKNPEITLKEVHSLINQLSYEEIIPYLESRPSWAKLSKHISLSKKNLANSKLFTSCINLLSKDHYIQDCSLKRLPEITCIRNSDLRLFIIASDGVIRSYFDYKDQYHSMITSYYKNPEKLMGAFKDFSSSINDDHSFICLFYNK